MHKFSFKTLFGVLSVGIYTTLFFTGCLTAKETTLHTAARENDVESINSLLYKDKDLDLEEKNGDGDTPLHIALKNKHPKSAVILVEQNSNIFATDGKGKTALEIGLARENENIFYEALLTTKTEKARNAQGQSIIHYLVKDRNIDGIKYCIQKKIPLSEKDTNDITPLELAYSQNDENSIQIAADLILANAEPVRGKYSYFEDAIKTRNPSMRFEEGKTPLHFAVIEGEEIIVQYLINQKANTKSKDISGSTPLHEAVRRGHLEIARKLIDSGADVDARDSMGKTPLLISTPENNREQMYKLLLSEGANANAIDSDGNNALHIATEAKVSIGVLKILVSKDTNIDKRNNVEITQVDDEEENITNIDKRNNMGITPLARAVELRTTEHIKYLVNLDADIHAEDSDSNTPLTKALDGGLDVTNKLINTKNISSQNSFGNTPLHIAVEKKVEIAQIQFLLNIGGDSDVNARNRDGNSPLHLAIQQNSSEIGKLLLTDGADVFSSNSKNDSPLHLALKSNEHEWILTSEVIKATDGIGNTPLHYAAKWKLNNAVSTILKKDIDPDTININGESAMFSAVKENNTEAMKLLLENNANLNLCDSLGNTALHISMNDDTKDAAVILLKNGIDINAQNLSGKTALHKATKLKNIDMVEFLLARGANIHAADVKGRTPLMDAVQAEDKHIVKLLIEKKASHSSPGIYGQNAYHEAAKTGNIDLIKLLREAGGNPLARDISGNTPFSLILDKGIKDIEVIKTVLGVDIHLADSDGNTPAHIFVTKYNDESILSLLIDTYPADNRNNKDITPLLLAVKKDNINLAQVLLKKGANPFIPDNLGESALSYALKNNNEKMLKAIVQTSKIKQNIEDETVLHYAARVADVNTVKYLLSLPDLDPTQKNIRGDTAHDIANHWKKDDIAALLK